MSIAGISTQPPYKDKTLLPSFYCIIYAKHRTLSAFFGSVEVQWELATTPVSDCHKKHGISCQKERPSVRFRVSLTGRTAANRSRTVKTWVEELFVWSISPPRRPFFRGKNRIAFRKEMDRLPQRRNFFCRKAVPAGAERRENKASEGFSRSGWSPPACKSRLSFCKPFPRRIDAGADSGRTAFRGRRQNVTETGFRLSSCIPLGAYGSRIPVLFPPRARLRGSRRGCLDVLTMSLETCCCPQAFWRFRDRRRQEAAGATETCKGVSEAHLSFLPGIAEIYGCPPLDFYYSPFFTCQLPLGALHS